MENKLKVGIIGAGQIARVTHLPAYSEMPEVEVTAICDTKEENARTLAEQFNIANYYSDYHELLNEQHPDAVTVCVPNKFHSSIVIDALNAGCNVLCEKPPAVSAKKAEEMAECAERNGKILTYDFHMRHSAEVRIAKSEIDRGSVGNIYHAKAYWVRRLGIPGWGSFTNKNIQGGGALIDIGAHVLDIALYLLNYPKISYVAAGMSDSIGKHYSDGLMGSWNPEKFSVEDGLFGMIHFINGATLDIDAAFALNIKEKDRKNVEIFGDKAGMSLFPLELYSGTGRELINTAYPFIETSDSHIYAIRNFVDSCLGKEKPLVTAAQGVYVQKVIEALYKSAETGEPVGF